MNMQLRLIHFTAILVLACLVFPAQAQRKKAKLPAGPPPVIDSIYFHLYTDSLKKQVYNYINVDARMSDSSWQPLSSDDLNFESTHGKWDGNNLIIDSSFKGDYVDITATLKQNTSLTRHKRIYIKKLEIVPVLKSEEEILRQYRRKN